MIETASGAKGQRRSRLAGAVGALLTSAFFGAVFAAAATAVETVMALFNGSYIATVIIAAVLAWWTVAGALAGLAVGLVTLPVTAFLPTKWKTIIPGAVILAGGFFAYAANIRANLVVLDPLGRSVLLNVYFLAAWGVALGAVYAVVAAREGAFRLFFLTSAAVLSCAGIAHFAWNDGAAYLLTLAPTALVVVLAALIDKVRSRAAGRLMAAGACAALAAALVVAAAARGALADGPIDRGYRAEPGKIALLAGKPNVVVVTLDTLRADHTSLCGNKYPTTPYLEKFAADCRFFPNGESVDSWTLPAHASMFTGEYPRQHGAHATSSKLVIASDGTPLNGIPLSSDRVTLATLLTAKGYHTAGFVANYVWLARQFGLDQGFQYYLDSPRFVVFTASGTPLYRRGAECVDALLGRNGKFTQCYWSARTVSGFASKWVARNGETPFFLFLNYMDPHDPYAPPPPFDHVRPGVEYNRSLANLRNWQELSGGYIRDDDEMSADLLAQIENQYDGELAYTDYWFGRFVESLKAQGIYDETLIIVTSDHGEFFGEHQRLGHGIGLYEGGTRIPILVKFPRQEHAGEVVDERVSIMDIFATVLDVLALPNPGTPAQPLGAVTHPIILEDYENGINVKRYGERFKGNRTAIREGDWKLITSTTAPDELYNLADDPAESTNLASRRPQVVARLRAQIDRWRESTSAFDASSAPGKVSDEMMERLRSLGYIGGGGD